MNDYRWHDAKKEKPEKMKEVLTVGKRGAYNVSRYSSDEEWIDKNCRFIHVSAWRELDPCDI